MPAVISTTVLVLAEGFAEGMSATRVAEAIDRGLCASGRLTCDLCPIDEPETVQAGTQPSEVSALLAELDFDRRMRAARALVIARERLDDRTLAGSVAFEAATRARQAGVPAYAVTGHDELDAFEARIVDLQAILQASTSRALSAAGRKLAGLV
jgi:glycerate kinase